MNREQLVAMVLIVIVVTIGILALVGVAVADGQNWRQQCVNAGGYVAQQGTSYPVCVR